MNSQSIQDAVGQTAVQLLPNNLPYWPGEWPWFFLAKISLKQTRQFFRLVPKEGWSLLINYWHWPPLGWNDDNLARAIRQFWDKNDAKLIVKARRKKSLRNVTTEQDDMVIDDESYYPRTVYKLMQVADLGIHFYSTAALEAACFDTSALCIHRTNLETVIHRLWPSNQFGGAFIFHVVNQWAGILAAICALPFQSLSNFAKDLEDRHRYTNKFLVSANDLANHVNLDKVDALLGTQVRIMGSSI